MKMRNVSDPDPDPDPDPTPKERNGKSVAGYTKFFTHMLDSSVWCLSKEARILWVTMLLKKNGEQIVEASLPGLARAANLTVEETKKALRELMSPDPDSRTKDEEGRRVVKVEGGWLIVNGNKYRDILTESERRERNRIRMSRIRGSSYGLPGEQRFVDAEKRGDQQGADQVLDDHNPHLNSK